MSAFDWVVAEPDRPIPLTVGGQSEPMDLSLVENQVLRTPMLGPGATVLHRTLMDAAAGDGVITAQQLVDDHRMNLKSLPGHLGRLRRFHGIQSKADGIEVNVGVRNLTPAQLARIPAVLTERYEQAGYGPTGATTAESDYRISQVHLTVEPPGGHNKGLSVTDPLVSQLRAAVGGPATAILAETLERHVMQGRFVVPVDHLAAELGLANARQMGNAAPINKAIVRLPHIGIKVSETVDANGKIEANVRLRSEYTPTENQMLKLSSGLEQKAQKAMWDDLQPSQVSRRRVSGSQIRPDATRLSQQPGPSTTPKPGRRPTPPPTIDRTARPAR